VGSLKRLRAREGSLALVIDADKILRIFRITGLHHVFALCPSVQQAVTTDQHWQAAVADDGHTIEEWCGKHGLLRPITQACPSAASGIQGMGSSARRH
jgi:anti-sigma B factor antagonist